MNQVNANLAATASTGNGAYSGTFIWPVAGGGTYVSSGYGSRWGTFHYGIDITSSSGNNPIVAAAAGRVTIASNTCSHNYRKDYNCGCNGGYGNYVVIDHGNGLLTITAICPMPRSLSAPTSSRASRSATWAAPVIRPDRISISKSVSTTAPPVRSRLETR